MQLVSCQGCGVEVEQTSHRSRKWCSDACRLRAYHADNPKPPRASRERFCSECSAQFITKSKRLTCSPGCAKARTNRLRRESKGWGAYIHTRRARQYAAVQGPVNRFRVADRDGWMCGICDEQIDRGAVYPDPASLSMDHVVPISAGGAHSESNLRPTHLRCNLVRGTRAA